MGLSVRTVAHNLDAIRWWLSGAAGFVLVALAALAGNSKDS